MLQGICINTDNTVVLTEFESYFLFPNGPDLYYVSRFPNENAHTGCFEAKQFQLIDEEELLMLEIDRKKVYLAHMHRKEGYPGLELKEYFIKPRKKNCKIYHDRSMTQFKGCFPLNWFIDFAEVVPQIAKSVSETGVNDTETKKNDHIVEEIEFRVSENGQLLLF